MPDTLVQARDRKLEIRCGYQLTVPEFDHLRTNADHIANLLVRSRVGTNSVAEIIAFMSSEAGIAAVIQAKNEIAAGILRLADSELVARVDLEIDFLSTGISSPDPISASFVAFLDQSLPFDQTKFSYFPADRALPRGDTGMQLGQQDSSQQLESHNSQPHLKYSRLKNTIFSTIMSSPEGRQLIEINFQEIFAGVLKGRKLDHVGFNEYGLMSVKIRDVTSGRVFDIDHLSSGEKGLVLTFLLISRTLADDSIVILDEPELHLNPAVCKDLLSYMVDNYVNPHNIQMIICSHSPEILAGAFERDECSLFHLISDTEITKVRRTDHNEITDALRLLGTSESEALLYKGTIFVEGPHDVEILEAGFPALFRNYRLKDLGGRNEVEKQIKLLQTADENNTLSTRLFFIFDKDSKPTDLQGSESVGVLQLSKYCLENYLIDLDALCDLLKDPQFAVNPVKNHGQLTSVIKRLAINHMQQQISREVFDQFRPESVKSPDGSLSNSAFLDVAIFGYNQIEGLREKLALPQRDEWIDNFVRSCEIKKASMSTLWDTKWKDLCDGKRLFTEMQKEFGVKTSQLNFKKRVMAQMVVNQVGKNLKVLKEELETLLRLN